MPKTYEISKQNKVRQIAKKASYDVATVHGILDSALLAHVGFVQDGEPVVVPMLFGRDGETIYLHGARKARIIRLLESTEKVCMNVMHLDGLVYARSAFNSSMNYRSATIFGSPRLLDGEREKLRAMRIITESTMPGRWNELRAPFEKEVKMTGIISIDIESASAKISAKEFPEDEDEDYEIPIWAGILPLRATFETLRPDARILEGVEPSEAVRHFENKTL